jgi:hypothetical protein
MYPAGVNRGSRSQTSMEEFLYPGDGGDALVRRRDLTRVEFRLKNQGPVSAIESIPNPFADLIVFDPTELAQFPVPHWIALQALGQLRARKRILTSLPKNCHLKIDKQLVKTEADWWDPDAIWKAWHECIKGVLPSAVDESGKLLDPIAAYLEAVNCPPDALVPRNTRTCRRGTGARRLGPPWAPEPVQSISLYLKSNDVGQSAWDPSEAD